MASAGAPAAAVPTLAPPLEQLRHLARELRLLLPGVRGELTQLGRATTGAGLGWGRGQVVAAAGAGSRAEEVGVRGDSAYLSLPFSTACPHATPTSRRSPGDLQRV